MTLMTGQLVELLQDLYGLPKGTQGIVFGKSRAGWVTAFGGVSVTLAFANEGLFYRFMEAHE